MEMPEESGSITPIPELFTYHIFGEPRELDDWLRDPDSYSFAISGLVERPQKLTLAQIRGDFEEVSADMVLQCTTNVHWGRVRFTGPRLLDVLEAAGPTTEATKLAIYGADGFDTDLGLEEIRREPDAFLIAHRMNDEPITDDHGFPVRLTARGRYGYKWCKWLSEIEAVDHDYKGHYEGRRGWSDAGIRGESII